MGAVCRRVQVCSEREEGGGFDIENQPDRSTPVRLFGQAFFLFAGKEERKSATFAVWVARGGGLRSDSATPLPSRPKRQWPSGRPCFERPDHRTLPVGPRCDAVGRSAQTAEERSARGGRFVLTRRGSFGQRGSSGNQVVCGRALSGRPVWHGWCALTEVSCSSTGTVVRRVEVCSRGRVAGGRTGPSRRAGQWVDWWGRDHGGGVSARRASRSTL